MKPRRKHDFAPAHIRRLLEPGPIVLVSSAWQGGQNIMTLGWHTLLEFSPALVGCVIARGSLTHDWVRQSGECVINIPDAAMVDTVVDIGNCSGADVAKFEHFNLTAHPAADVNAPLIAECFANLECRVADTRMVDDYDFFILEVVHAHVNSGRRPRTLHYKGEGQFMLSGRSINRKERFKPKLLIEG